MARYGVLNNVSHKDLRNATGFGPEYGYDGGMVPAVPSEFAELQREYPIFLRKDSAEGTWQSVALLGFEQRENLFLRDGRWNDKQVVSSFQPVHLHGGRATALALVFTELLQNALEHGGDDVHVSLSVEDGTVALTVAGSDSGGDLRDQAEDKP